MKRIVLTFCVVALFITYSYVVRHHSTKIVLKPSLVGSAQTTQPGTSSSSTTVNTVNYKDSTYTGSSADAFYGTIQVVAAINSGKLTDVQFLQYPRENPNSIAINEQAMPLLKQEAIQAQSANVNIISGATDTSQAFIQSLSNALSKAQ